MKLKETWVEVPAGVGTSRFYTVRPGYYEVSSFGRVRNKKTKQLLGCWRQMMTVKGVRKCDRFNMLKAHLIYGAFHHCNTWGVKIYHIDGDMHNNKISNLATTDDLKEMGLL